MKTLLILNGPPRSGKDTIAKRLTDFIHVEFKEELFSMAIEMSGVPSDEWFARYEGYIQENGPYENFKTTWLKNEPWDKLNGLSQREFMIKVSEEWAKPLFGKDVFGKRLKERLDCKAWKEDESFVTSDGGFFEEMLPFIRDNNWNVFICRLHREGCTFEGDSRNYLHNIVENEFDVYNNGLIYDVVDDINSKFWEIK